MAAVAAMCLTGCQNNKTAEEALDFEKATPEAVVNALAEKVQAGDATAIAEAVETVKTELQGLLDEGNVEKLNEYAAKIQSFVEENAEALKGAGIDVAPLTNVLDQVKALPTSAQEAAEAAAEDAVDAAKAEAEEAVEGAVEAGKSAVNDAVEAGKKAAGDAVEAGKKAANDAVEAGKAAVEEGKTKTNDAIQSAADKIKL